MRKADTCPRGRRYASVSLKSFSRNMHGYQDEEVLHVRAGFQREGRSVMGGHAVGELAHGLQHPAALLLAAHSSFSFRSWNRKQVLLPGVGRSLAPSVESSYDMRVLNDEEIAQLVSEPKECPEDWRGKLTARGAEGMRHATGSFTAMGAAGHEFTVLTRLLPADHLNFSAILRFDDTDGAQYNLIRCNGIHGQHTNDIEKEQSLEPGIFVDEFHVHRATERYQLRGFYIEKYAEPTREYQDFWGAVLHLLRLGSFNVPRATQRSFEDVDGEAGR